MCSYAWARVPVTFIKYFNEPHPIINDGIQVEFEFIKHYHVWYKTYSGSCNLVIIFTNNYIDRHASYF